MSDPSEILTRRLRDVIAGEQSARGLHFFCQIGGSGHAFGMTTLQISGTGNTLLGWRQEDERVLFSVKLTAEDQRRFCQMLLEHPFWELPQTKRAPRGEELNIHVRLCDQQEGSWHGLQFWEGDLKQVPVLQNLMYRVSRLVRSISDGEVPCPSWTLDDR